MGIFFVYLAPAIKLVYGKRREEKEENVCRTILLDHMFATPVSHNSTKLHETSLYLWVPSSIYIHENLNHSFVSSLTKKDFHGAFRSAFLTDTTPSPVHNAIAPEWVRLL